MASKIGGFLREFRVAADNFAHGGPKGKQIYENPDPTPLEHVGYHGTTLERVEDQIFKGEFTNKGRDIYFVPGRTLNADVKAGFWAGKGPKSVVLEVTSNRPAIKNRVFDTDLFPKGDAQKVKILRAWEVDSNWKERAWEQKQTPSVFQSIRDYFLEK